MLKYLIYEFVKENEDCLESVTAALKWFDQSTDCDVPRPHYPRKALETGVVVFLGIEVDWESASDEPSQISFYLLGTDELFRLPAHINTAHGILVYFHVAGKYSLLLITSLNHNAMTQI